MSAICPAGWLLLRKQSAQCCWLQAITTCSWLLLLCAQALQLLMRVQVGITAMLIASKYEDVWAPEVRDFVYISDHAYTAEQILEMEKIMLNTLRFQLTVRRLPVMMCMVLFHRLPHLARKHAQRRHDVLPP